MSLRRQGESRKVTINNVAASSTAIIQMKEFSGGGILIGSSWTSCNVSIYGYSTVDDDYVLIHDASGNAATIATTMDKAYQFPTSVFPFEKIKLVSDNAANNAIAVQVDVKG